MTSYTVDTFVQKVHEKRLKENIYNVEAFEQ